MVDKLPSTTHVLELVLEYLTKHNMIQAVHGIIQEHALSGGNLEDKPFLAARVAICMMRHLTTSAETHEELAQVNDSFIKLMKLIEENYNKVQIPSTVLYGVQIELLQQVVSMAVLARSSSSNKKESQSSWKNVLDQYFPLEKTFANAALEKQKLQFRQSILKAAAFDETSLTDFVKKFSKLQFIQKFKNLLLLIEDKLLGPSVLEEKLKEPDLAPISGSEFFNTVMERDQKDMFASPSSSPALKHPVSIHREGKENKSSEEETEDFQEPCTQMMPLDEDDDSLDETTMTSTTSPAVVAESLRQQRKKLQKTMQESEFKDPLSDTLNRVLPQRRRPFDAPHPSAKRVEFESQLEGEEAHTFRNPLSPLQQQEAYSPRSKMRKHGDGSRKKRYWTELEVEALKLGNLEYGTQWKKIKEKYSDVLHSRSTTDLKDKMRQQLRKAK